MTTWNPSDKHADITLTNGDLTAENSTGGTNYMVRSTNPKYAWGLLYVEFFIDLVGTTSLGVALASAALNSQVGLSAASWGLLYDGRKYHPPGPSSYGSAISNSDIVMMAVNLYTNSIWWGKNGAWFNSGNPANGTNPAYTDLSSPIYVAGSFSNQLGGSKATANFGASAFTYTPPTGYRSWDSDEGISLAKCPGQRATLLRTDLRNRSWI